MGDSGGTTNIMDTSYQQKTSVFSPRATKTKLLQVPIDGRRSNRRTDGHWRTQSACDGINHTEFTIDPVSEAVKAEANQSIPAMAAYDQYRERLKNQLQDKLHFCDQL